MADETKVKPEKAAKSGKKPPIKIIVGVVVLLIIMMVAKGVLGKSKPKNKKAVSHQVGISIPMDEFLVNLTGGDHYLRATVSLGMAKDIKEEETKEKMAPMRDAVLTALSSKSLKDLSSENGREALKKELVDKVNAAAGSDMVVKVYFTAFATQ